MLDAVTGTTIGFDPIIFPVNNPATIAVASWLPFLNQGNLTIDGSGAGVILDGNLCPNVSDNGLTIHSNNNRINNLEIINFPNHGIRISDGASHNIIENSTIRGNKTWGIAITGVGTTDNQVTGNRIGTDATGTIAMGNSGFGIAINLEASNNTIDNNVVSGNTSDGIWITDSGTMSNTVSGNHIGTDASGTVAIGNGGIGVHIRSGSQYNTIGGDSPALRNIISGNGASGVAILNNNTNHNVVSGNYIGLDINGAAAIPNSRGMWIGLGAQHNTVGGTSPGERNVISGNTDYSSWATGISIGDASTNYNRIIGNYIGTDATGTLPLG